MKVSLECRIWQWDVLSKEIWTCLSVVKVVFFPHQGKISANIPFSCLLLLFGCCSADQCIRLFYVANCWFKHWESFWNCSDLFILFFSALWWLPRLHRYPSDFIFVAPFKTTAKILHLNSRTLACVCLGVRRERMTLSH